MLQKITYMWLPTPTISASVEIRVFIYYLIDLICMAPFPIDIITPEWIFMSGCNLYDASVHHLINIELLDSIIRGIYTSYLM